MKFSELAPGQRFEFEGRLYVKEGPVLAREVGTGRLRMIPRYAILRPVDEGGARSDGSSGPAWLPVVEAFYREALAALEEGPEAGRQRLEQAWRRLCEFVFLSAK